MKTIKSLITSLTMITFIILMGLLFGCSIKQREKPIEKEYTVSAIVYFENGISDTVSSTVICSAKPEYSLVIRNKKSYLFLMKGLADYDIIASGVTHFKQINNP